MYDPIFNISTNLSSLKYENIIRSNDMMKKIKYIFKFGSCNNKESL